MDAFNHAAPPPRIPSINQMLSVLHKFLGTSVLLPSLSAASNLVHSPLAGAPPPSFYAVLQAVHRWVDTYKVCRWLDSSERERDHYTTTPRPNLYMLT